MDRCAEFSDRLETCFWQIAEVRMEGIPILNPALSVKAVGTRALPGGLITILVTPWFINMILKEDEADPDQEEDLPVPVRVGVKRSFTLPAGQFEFIAGHEEAIGPYWMCSLFSPVLDFENMDAAMIAAHAAMEELFGDTIAPEEDELALSMMWRGERPVVEPEGPSDTAHDTQDVQPGEEADLTDVPSGLSRREMLRGFRREQTKNSSASDLPESGPSSDAAREEVSP